MSELPLTAYRCKNCGHIHYPFHDRCLECRGREFEEIHPQGSARLLTYTAIFNLPYGFDQQSLILGIAEFENKVKALGQIKAQSVNQLKAGMTVKAVWEPIRSQPEGVVFGLKFEPLET
ncbi:MAG: Zn-ribbon domain-containing OB-fold protein [Chloroflexota bacterium]|nr:hypothetical protein [Chloroflexota bacterium]MBI5703572.1 hypothetical protein [Chloroflexota bacterium]